LSAFADESPNGQLVDVSVGERLLQRSVGRGEHQSQVHGSQRRVTGIEQI
jgi:hypothetical protein